MRIAPTVDMSAYSLQTLINLMLAQAQECVWQKAAMDQLRDGTIARLAIKISEFYDIAHDFASNSSIQSVYPTAWLVHIQLKALHFNAAAQFRKSCECLSQDKYGEELSRLQIASDYVKRALDVIKVSQKYVSTPVINDLKSLQLIIAANLARAEKDNNVIYLARIPPASSLPAILKTQMVNAIPPPEISDPVSLMLNNENNTESLPHPVIGLPLFQKLVPFAVHQAASVYVDRKERLIKEDIVAKLDELTGVYNSSVESLNLIPLLAAADSNTGIPEGILKQAAEVRSEGGSKTLYDLWEKVQKASSSNAEILEEAFNALDEEHEADEALRLKYGAAWNRPESNALTQQLVTQGQKHRYTLTSAQKADVVVRSKLDTWSKIIDVLTITREELEDSIPSDDGNKDPQKSQLVRIKRLIEDMNQHIRLRRNLIDQAKKASTADDISPALLKKAAELTAKSPTVKIEAAQFEELFIEGLRKYDSFVMAVDKEDEQQNAIIRQLNDAYQQHVSRSPNGGSAKREKALQNLHQAYLKYREIKTNLSEGLKFYEKHAQGLQMFCGTCIDYCHRREIESEALRNMLQ
ncbi:ALIX V-shaped domain binding to HIV-domain-containing protein [Sporodiniella umbellata]|nr:ALIX V-shaped domain binding to HIV-domain-containing protein [Sporodiniella umbellata]